MRLFQRLSLLLFLAGLAGCAGVAPAPPPPAPLQPVAAAPPPLTPRPFFVQTGLASFYGRGEDGRATADGESFDRHDFTAAHRTLKFGT
ncbi:MAG: septal ring lytic transglycosylase RlpA family protein, partial [Rhizomicrobium sp.]